ncbi:hypothetical protein ACFX11_038354 [Malus domestica]
MNRKEIRIWRDRWLLALPNGHPIPSGTVQVSCNTTVDSLTNPANGDWDIQFLKLFISLKEVDTILETQIGDPMIRDMLVWPLDKKKVFIM